MTEEKPSEAVPDPHKDVRRVAIDAFCMECDRVTPHVAIYVGHLLKARRCRTCGYIAGAGKLDLVKSYFDDALDRVLTKPGRLLKEFPHRRAMFAHALKRLPGKSIEEISYIKELLVDEEDWEK